MTVLEQILNKIEELKTLRDQLRTSITVTYGVDASDMNLDEIMTFTKTKNAYGIEEQTVPTPVVSEDTEYDGYIDSRTSVPVMTDIWPSADMDVELIAKNVTTGGSDWIASHRNQFRMFGYEGSFYFDTMSGRSICEVMSDQTAEHTFGIKYGFAVPVGDGTECMERTTICDDSSVSMQMGPTYNVYNTIEEEFTLPLVIYGRTDVDDSTYTKSDLSGKTVSELESILNPQFGVDTFDFIALKIYNRINGERTLVHHLVAKKDDDNKTAIYDRVTGNYYYGYNGDLYATWYDGTKDGEETTPTTAAPSEDITDPTGYLNIPAGTTVQLDFALNHSSSFTFDVADIDYSSGDNVLIMNTNSGGQYRGTFVSSAGRLYGEGGAAGHQYPETVLDSNTRYKFYDFVMHFWETDGVDPSEDSSPNKVKMRTYVDGYEDAAVETWAGPNDTIDATLDTQWGGTPVTMFGRSDASNAYAKKFYQLIITELVDNVRTTVHNLIGRVNNGVAELYDTITGTSYAPTTGSFTFVDADGNETSSGTSDVTDAPTTDAPSASGYLNVAEGTVLQLDFNLNYSSTMNYCVEDVDYTSGDIYLLSTTGTDGRTTYVSSAGILTGGSGAGGGAGAQDAIESTGKYYLKDISSPSGTNLVIHSVKVYDSTNTTELSESGPKGIGPNDSVFSILNEMWGGTIYMFSKDADGTGSHAMKFHSLEITEIVDDATTVVHNLIGRDNNGTAELYDTVTGKSYTPSAGSFTFVAE